MKEIIHVFKSIAVAFSTYSRIPMPKFNWDSKDMKYQMIFFPWVGLFIGGLELLTFYLTNRFEALLPVRVYISLAIPLLVTGGLHVDGFMDTCDGLHSYKSKEEKIKILKDPHIGAFSVICLCICGLIYLSGLSLLTSFDAYLAFAFSFVISRAISGISLMTLRSAKKEGMLYVTKENSSRQIVLSALIIELIICFMALAFLDIYLSLIIAALQALFFIYYKKLSYKEFGGITGDTSGYLLTISEGLSLVCIAIYFVIA